MLAFKLLFTKCWAFASFRSSKQVIICIINACRYQCEVIVQWPNAFWWSKNVTYSQCTHLCLHQNGMRESDFSEEEEKHHLNQSDNCVNVRVSCFCVFGTNLFHLIHKCFDRWTEQKRLCAGHNEKAVSTINTIQSIAVVQIEIEI